MPTTEPRTLLATLINGLSTWAASVVVLMMASISSSEIAALPSAARAMPPRDRVSVRTSASIVTPKCFLSMICFMIKCLLAYFIESMADGLQSHPTDWKYRTEL